MRRAVRVTIEVPPFSDQNAEAIPSLLPESMSVRSPTVSASGRTQVPVWSSWTSSMAISSFTTDAV